MYYIFFINTDIYYIILNIDYIFRFKGGIFYET